MSFSIHLTICIIFLFSTWVYFLKCEINELRRRLSEATGERVEETHAVQLEHAMVTATGLNTPTVAHVRADSANRHHSRRVEASSETRHNFHQRGGIPTWTIE